MPRRLTHEQFIERLQQINPNIEILGTYINSKTKIKCKCKICRHEWETIPSSLLRGHGCPKCGGTGKLTHEEFMEKFNKQNKHSQDIEIMGTYINAQTKIKCKCKIDGHEWETIPSSLLQGKGCPKCGCSVKSTHEEFMEKFYKQNKHAQDIEILGTYIARKTKINCKCKIDGYEWTPMANQLLHGQGCPKCGGTKKLTHKEFIKRLQHINSNIEVLGTYKNNRTKIKCKCKKCEHEWTATPRDLLQGYGCPKCNTSKGEKRIAQYLDNLGIHYIYDKKYFKDLVSTGGSTLRPDFVIPSLKIWIEFDGQQHFRLVDFTGAMSEQQLQDAFKKVQQNDQIKDQYAKDNNWTLIRIPFTEYDNIEQILAAYIEQEEQAI